MSEEEKGPPKPEWKYKEEFNIVGNLRKAVTAAKEASEKDLVVLRRRLEKLTYGS